MSTTITLKNGKQLSGIPNGTSKADILQKFGMTDADFAGAKVVVSPDRAGPQPGDTPPPAPGAVETERLRAAMQGLTLGFGDEMEAALRAPFSDRSYGDIRDEIRGDIGAYQKAHPWESLALEAGGGLLTGGLGAGRVLASQGARKAVPWLTQQVGGRATPTLRGLAAAGAGEGAIAGAGYANEVEDMPTSMLLNAGLGGLMAPAIGGGMNLLGRAITGRTPGGRAGRELEHAMDTGGYRTTGQVGEELQALGPHAMLADLPGFGAKARKISAEPGPGRATLDAALDERQLGQVDRLKGQLGVGEDFVDYTNAIEHARRTASKPHYELARLQRIDPTQPMLVARGTPEGTAAWAEARQRYMSRNYLTEADMVDVDLDIQPDMWDQWGRRMRGKAEQAYRSGDRDAGSYITDNLRVANESIYKQIPELKVARGVARQPITMQKAAEEGRKLFSGQPDIKAEQLRKMSPNEKDAFLKGATRALFDKLEGSVETANAARNLIKTQKVRKIIRNAFPDTSEGSDDYWRFIEQMSREAHMGETFSNIRRGSRTAFVEAEKADEGRFARPLVELMQGNFSRAAQDASRRLAAGGSSAYPEEVSRQLGGLLSQQGPDAMAGLLGGLQTGRPSPVLPYTGLGILGATQPIYNR